MTRDELVAKELAEYREHYGPGPSRGRTKTGILFWMAARYSMQLARKVRRGDVPRERCRFTWRELVAHARQEARSARKADRRAA